MKVSFDFDGTLTTKQGVELLKSHIAKGDVVYIITRRRKSFDEPVYLKCGLDCWNNHTHKPLMRLGTMPLPVDLETLPLYLWCHFSGKQLDWENDFGWMLGVARTTALVFWWNLLFQCFRLGCIVRGPWCGFFALAAVAVEPNLMGHAALVGRPSRAHLCRSFNLGVLYGTQIHLHHHVRGFLYLLIGQLVQPPAPLRGVWHLFLFRV